MSIDRPQRGRTRHRGFTLAEMGVVVVILGLLSVSMLPDYLRTVYRARRTEALFALHAIHDFESVHFATNGEYSNSFPALGYELDARQAREFDPLLASGYRDHAVTGSMFIGTLASSWAELDSAARRAHAELIRDRALEGGAVELLLFDGDRVLQAHWSAGAWRTVSWER